MNPPPRLARIHFQSRIDRLEQTMKYSIFAISAGLSMLFTAVMSGPAQANSTTLAWPASVHLMDIVIATAARPNATAESEAAISATASRPAGFADVVISTDGDLELRKKAAAALREALAANRITLDSSSVHPANREPAL
jgi:Kef-type K+ transport system membrane component KefB